MDYSNDNRMMIILRIVVMIVSLASNDRLAPKLLRDFALEKWQ